MLQTLSSFKSNNLITVNDTKRYGESDHVISLLKLLNNVDNGKILKKNAVDIRNFFMVLIVFGNAARSSNITNMTISDFNDAQEEPDYNLVLFHQINNFSMVKKCCWLGRTCFVICKHMLIIAGLF